MYPKHYTRLFDLEIRDMWRGGSMQEERWDFIDNWPNYIVSTHGRVYNIQTEKWSSFTSDGTWYPRVRLVRDDFVFVEYVHRLVGFAFVDGYFEGAVINHKDGNKRNNYFENLEWITQQQNVQHEFDTFGDNRRRRSYSKKA
jgi:hypothetical protein